MILTRHLTPTLTVVVLATIAPLHDDEPDAHTPYPRAPTGMPIDGRYHPCHGTNPGELNLVCSVQYGDAP